MTLVKEDQLTEVKATLLNQLIHFFHVLRGDLVLLAQSLAEVGQQSNAFEQIILVVIRVWVIKC